MRIVYSTYSLLKDKILKGKLIFFTPFRVGVIEENQFAPAIWRAWGKQIDFRATWIKLNSYYSASMLATVLLCSCSQSQRQEIDSTNFSYDFSHVKSKIQHWVDQGYYPGASIIVAKDDQIIYEDYFGNYKPETVVYIASAGKWLAAAAVAAIVEEGKLSWDDKVEKWLPEVADVKGEATLRQLFSHTSGYPDYQPENCHPDDYQSLEEAVNHIVDLPADTIPGAEFHYGGLAMQVAGRMSELATGKDFETIFQEKIARPLGMTNTHFTPVDSTQGHNPMIGGGARCTLHDYAHFLEMILNDGIYKGKKILESSSIAEMQADQVREAAIYAGEYVENARAVDHKSIYGLGEWREILNDKGEAVLISSPSWAGAYPWIDKENNIYGFFLAHVAPEVADKDGFSSFLSSPVLAMMARDAIYQVDDGIERGKIDVAGANLYYEMMGEGEPLVLLHGHSFDTRMWDPQFYELAKHYKVIRYDLRGYGRSDNPVEGKEFLHAEDLKQLLEALHIQKVHLVGLSLGSYVTADFMALYPENVLSATMASGAVYDHSRPDIPVLEDEVFKRSEEIAALKKDGVQAFKRKWLAGLMNSVGSNGGNIKPELWKMISEWSAWQPLHVEPRLLLGRSVRDKIKGAEINVPVLFIYGENDSEGSHRSSDELVELIPNAQKVRIEDSGHMSNMETPEAFNRALSKFLKSASDDKK